MKLISVVYKSLIRIDCDNNISCNIVVKATKCLLIAIMNVRKPCINNNK